MSEATEPSRVARPVRDSLPHPAALLAFAFALFYLADTVADPDLWGHVRFGQDILRERAIPRVDPYSFLTADSTWINHEWLAEVIFAATFDALGPSGLIGLKLLSSASIVGAGLVHLRRRGLGPIPAAFLVIVVTIPLRLGLGLVRPHLFTYLGTLGLLLLIEAADRGARRRIWLAPPLLALWANLHGGFLAGLGMLGVWIGARLFAIAQGPGPAGARSREALGLSLLGIASTLATLVNPYGVELLEFLLRTATVPRPEILEWRPLDLTTLPGLIYLGLIGLTLAAECSSGPGGSLARRALLAVLAVLPMLAARHLPLFEIGVVVLGAGPIADLASRRQRPSWGPAILGRLAKGLAIAAALGYLAATPWRLGCVRIEPTIFPFPVVAVAALKASGVEGRLVVEYDWGEYALWHLAPRVLVSLDGRRETVYPEPVYREQLDFRDGLGDWDALLRRPGVDLVLMSRGHAAFALMQLAPGWSFVYRDPLCGLFVRSDRADLIERIVRTPLSNLPHDGGGLCFPAPAARRPR